MFIVTGQKQDTLVTLNSVPGYDVYGEKRITVDVNIGQIIIILLHLFTSKQVNST